MKTSLLSILAFSAVLSFAAAPVALADAGLQNGSPGAQGTEGTNPTHQDSNPTGPNGEHSTNVNPDNTPAPAHQSSTTSTSTNN